MALNLSRNTKVFVSSVNGVPIAGGGVLTGFITNQGSNYEVGDIVTCGAPGGNGAGFKCIVLTETGNAVTSVAIPNNLRGEQHVTHADSATNGVLTSSAVQANDGTNNATATGLAIRLMSVTGTTTAEGARAGTGRFRGNSTDANTFRIGVLDGYSFSQGSESTDVTISEAGSTPNRGSKRFNDALPPAEWSFGTYVRPFVHGAASFRTAADHDCVENIMWAALAGTGLPGDAAASQNANDAAGGAVTVGTSAQNGSVVDFLASDVHELMKLNIYFVLENTTYRLNDAQVNSAEIDFSIDGIAQITWSGNATTIDQVTTAIEDPSKYATVAQTSAGTMDEGNTDTYVEAFSYVDTVGPADADYLRNKLSSLYLDTDLQGGGATSQGLSDKTYDINITGGSISIQNNVTYVTPETIGIVDKPIGSFTGARTITGSLTMYLDNKANGSNDLLTDLAGATDLVTNEFDMRLFMGVANSVSGDSPAMAAGQFSAPGVEFNMPKCHLQVPTIETGDLISTTVEFAAHGSDLLTGNEMKVKYLGSTAHTQAATGTVAGYAASGSGDRSSPGT